MTSETCLARLDTNSSNQPTTDKMSINGFKKLVATRIFASKSTKIPSRVQNWAQSKIAALTDVPAATTAATRNAANTSPDTSPGYSSDNASSSFSAAQRDSSSSSLPMLSLTLESTKINTRSCLKKTDGGSPTAAAKKRAAFAVDDVLMTCMATGARMPPRLHTSARQEAFLARSSEQTSARRAARKERRLARGAAGITRGADDEDNSGSDEDRDPWETAADSDPEDADECIFDPACAYDNALLARMKQAEVAQDALDMHAAASGALDFALYVTGQNEALTTLENKARELSQVVKIASFRGPERRHAYRRHAARSQLPAELYDCFHTSMSGNRGPTVMLKTPVARRAARAPVNAY